MLLELEPEIAIIICQISSDASGVGECFYLPSLYLLYYSFCWQCKKIVDNGQCILKYLRYNSVTNY